MMCRPVAVTLKLQPDSELEEALNVLRLLTRNGADLNAVNDDGDTPMHLFLGRRGGLLPKRFVLPIVMAMLDEGRLAGILETIADSGDTKQIIFATHDQDLARSFPVMWNMRNGVKETLENEPLLVTEEINR